MMRKISLLIALLAYSAPPLWAYFAIAADHKAQLASRSTLCGEPILGIVLLAGTISSILSLVATGFGAASFYAIHKPWPKTRMAELGFLFLPFFLVVSYFIILFSS